MTDRPARIALIVAMADNRIIGAKGGLPWRIPADLKHFKSMTMGKPVVMGRRTFESIGRALPGRRNLVLTRNPDWRVAGCEVVTTPAAAIVAAGDSALYVIGGAEVFTAFWPRVRRLELTEVHGDIEGDTRLAGFDRRQWRRGQ